MDTLSHNWHQNGFNEVVDVNAVFFTDSLELAVNGRVNLEANVLPIEHGLGVLGGQPHRIYDGSLYTTTTERASPFHAATPSFSSGQIKCQSSGRNSCLVTIFLVHCSMATHTFSSKVRLPYATLVRWRAVVPTLSANAWRSCGGISKRYFLSSMAVLYTTWCSLWKTF